MASTTETAPIGALVVVVLTAGCAASAGTAGGPAPGPPVPAYEAEAAAATAPVRPLHILFSWSLQEQDARFSGKGSTRLEPPLRARVDLFGPRSEAYLSAALVEMDLRLPTGVQDVPLPPPALFWAALGVFRPPAAAQLTGSAKQGTTLRLDYAKGEERWSFRFENEKLRHAEWTGPGEGRRTVELEGAAEYDLPRQASYRDWRAFRELRLTLDEASETNGFPADIWTIGR